MSWVRIEVADIVLADFYSGVMWVKE